MPRSRSKSQTRSRSPTRSRSQTRSRSPTPSQSRSRSPSATPSPLSNRDNESDGPNEYRLHIAELPQGTQEDEVRKVFERFGTLTDVWVASASCFGFVVYKQKGEAQKALEEMDGRYEKRNKK